MQADKISEYAIDSLHIKRYATISPMDDSHFIRMVNQFVKSVEGSDGEIIVKEWYYSGEQDFHKVFIKIKRKGLKYTFMDSVLTIEPDLSPEEIDSLYIDYLQPGCPWRRLQSHSLQRYAIGWSRN